ncbi:hypothetical protein IFM89_022775 [Coptis chinensis]|uniref:Reverse transcriptase zinc-binding domain-containing protein n=1 Tax=Coptis chinensis TaxID=261450 RepID=A0A835M6J2_9MAGN|nr:hypothetical protein IFM89_022775 [Coptis chinensis]
MDSVKIVAILEPFIHHDDAGDIARKIDFQNFLHNGNIDGKVWIFWRDPVNLSLFGRTNQIISCMINVAGAPSAILSVVYAKCLLDQRRPLWDEMKEIADIERDGWVHSINECGLLEIPFQGLKFTWCNERGGGRRIWARLDRVFMNSGWLTRFPLMKIDHLARN